MDEAPGSHERYDPLPAQPMVAATANSSCPFAGTRRIAGASRWPAVCDAESSIDIAALQRQRLIENVEDPHRSDRLCNNRSILFQGRPVSEFAWQELSYR
jgi:hypothetical protein